MTFLHWWIVLLFVVDFAGKVKWLAATNKEQRTPDVVAIDLTINTATLMAILYFWR